MSVNAQNDVEMLQASREQGEGMDGHEETNVKGEPVDPKGQPNQENNGGSVNTRVARAAAGFLNTHLRQQIEAYKLRRVELLKETEKVCEPSEGKAELFPEDSTLLACDLLRITQTRLANDN